MRSIIFALTLVLSTVAQAYPTIGDRAEFVGVITGWDGIPKMAEMSFAYTAYNADTNEWTQRQETTVDGKVQVDERVMKPNQVPTQSDVMSYLNDCVAKGGQSGTLKTPAGDIKACAIAQKGADFESIFYVADVPFAYAGFDFTLAGIRTQMFLKSVTYGK
jgi:hypothetical protein